ncbi:beta-hexosaminidase subunit beta-like [Saccoglossus kowalevskii]|uniref:Beta-hexosaminidase n=1 Tax=Saccoglossus kowalevskii TaxID=10224 RepID=A0ABM0MYA3_SACKO|nr:PREDICTED: beta-hexosaminidase subunit beta-like [Saccoglossus kowalevskii]
MLLPRASVVFCFFATFTLVYSNSKVVRYRKWAEEHPDAFVNQETADESLQFSSKPQIEASSGSVWPMPQLMQVQENRVFLSADTFEFSFSMHDCDTLQSAFKRYYHIIFDGHLDTKLKFSPRVEKQESNCVLPSCDTAENTMLEGLVVELDTPCEKYPSLESNETYTLNVKSPTAKLSASSIWGALRGKSVISIVFMMHVSFEIQETKKMLIEIVSNYFITLLQSLDAMAYNKFNVFHWHIVDDQSFPYQSAAFPNLNVKGAFPPYYHHSYTQEDVAIVIEYARQRGIRVVAEFDSPGHSQSWGLSQKDLLTPCYSSGKPDGSFGPINPILNSTYDFLKKFFGEVVTVFPDHYVHLGGDEVSFTCWKSNPDITAFMKKMGYGDDYSKLESYYIQRLLDIMKSLKAGYLVWQEVFDNGVKVATDTVIHTWKGGYTDELGKITKAGYKTVLSSPWYLNYISDPYDEPWKNYYKIDPQNFSGSQAQKDLVMGGEACMWGEYVDGTNLIQRLWPNAAAIGERLWSSADTTDFNAAAPRLVEQRCRMVKRGLQAEPVSGPGYCKYEYSP